MLKRGAVHIANIPNRVLIRLGGMAGDEPRVLGRVWGYEKAGARVEKSKNNKTYISTPYICIYKKRKI